MGKLDAIRRTLEEEDRDVAESVDEDGTATYAIHRNERLGRALEDIEAGATGDVLVGDGRGMPANLRHRELENLELSTRDSGGALQKGVTVWELVDAVVTRGDAIATMDTS